jgi:hypothetical protein
MMFKTALLGFSYFRRSLPRQKHPHMEVLVVDYQ